MHILLINHYAGSRVHGMEYRPYYLAREWVKSGHQVTILSSSFSHVRARQPDTKSPVDETWLDNIRYIWLKTPTYQGNTLGRAWNILTFSRKVFQLAPRLVRKLSPDVVIASSTHPFDIYGANRMARVARCPLIFEVHDLWPLSPMELGGYPRYHPFIMLAQHAEDFAYAKAHITVSILPNTLAHMEDRGLSADRWHHIPNGIVLDEWINPPPLNPVTQTKIQDIRKKYDTLVCYAGAHGVANDLTVFLRAAGEKEMEQTGFILAGHGPEKPALQALSRELGLQNLFFLDPVPKQEVPSLLSSFDILFISLQDQPLFRFGVSPNKLFDYMMASRPVICAIRAGNDLVAQARCGTSISPGDPRALVRSLLEMKAMSLEERRQLGENGRRYVMENHEYGLLAKRFAELIERTITAY